MSEIGSFMLKDEDGVQIEFEIDGNFDSLSSERQEIQNNIDSIDDLIIENQSKIDRLNDEIDIYTNDADKLDMAVAITSGIITGFVDAIVVGEWNFKDAKAKSNEKVNRLVIDFAKKDPRYLPWCENISHNRVKRNPERLESAIEFLEQHYHLPGDGAYQNVNVGINGSNHRLDDFCHHPTIVGLICCVIVQFTGSTIYSHNSGEIIRIPLNVNEHGKFVGANTPLKFLAGMINWFFNIAKNQKGHLMSDIATSAGLPGPIISTLKELSALPCFKEADFAEKLRRAYQNGIGTGNKQIDLGIFNKLFEGASSKLDKRTEMAIASELERQTLPVIINEVLVRGFYFVRRFIEEVREHKSLEKINWRYIIPIKNRTIVRMMTVASGTFMAMDLADAAIETAVKNPEACTSPASFASSMILRVNFVGMGRFVVAIGTDIGMGVHKSKLEKQRTMLVGEQIRLLNAKVYYKVVNLEMAEAELYEAQKDVWVEAKDTVEFIKKTIYEIESLVESYIVDLNEIKEGMNNIENYIVTADTNNPGLRNDILNLITWGEK